MSILGNKNYKIRYIIYDMDGAEIKSGTIRVKNRPNSIKAQIDLEKYFKKHFPGLGRMVVLSCEEDLDLKDLFDFFR